MKKLKPLLIILAIYLVFVFLFVRPKFGPQIQRIPTDFENTPALGLNLDLPTNTDISKEYLPAEQLAAFDKLTENYSLAENTVIKSVSSKDFADTSLDCPSKDSAYSQVITPGYLFLLQTDTGETKDYRISTDLKSFTQCPLDLNISN